MQKLSTFKSRILEEEQNQTEMPTFTNEAFSCDIEDDGPPHPPPPPQHQQPDGAAYMVQYQYKVDNESSESDEEYSAVSNIEKNVVNGTAKKETVVKIVIDDNCNESESENSESNIEKQDNSNGNEEITDDTKGTQSVQNGMENSYNHCMKNLIQNMKDLQTEACDTSDISITLEDETYALGKPPLKGLIDAYRLDRLLIAIH